MALNENWILFPEIEVVTWVLELDSRYMGALFKVNEDGDETKVLVLK